MPDDIDLKKVGEIGVSPIKVRLTPTEDVIIDVSKTKKVTVIGLEPEATNSASAQKGSDMNGFTKFLAGVAIALVGLWLAAGLFYYYGQIDKAPPLWPTGSHDNGIGDNRSLSAIALVVTPVDAMPAGTIRAPIDRQPGPPPQSGQWEAVDNTAIQVPDGWTLSGQGPSCPSGTRRVATGKTKTLPNGDVMAEEICQ